MNFLRRDRIGLPAVLILSVLIGTSLISAQETVLFAVVTNVSKDKKQATAQVVSTGAVSEAVLIPTEAVLENLIWKKLEACHSLRADASKIAEGYRIYSIKILDAGMLPMPLQGVAGDCLLKKALEFAPLVD
jgi:hypothetical protein